MLRDIAKSNFRFSQNAHDALQALSTPKITMDTNNSTLLPYIFWAYEVRQMKDSEIVKRAGPGYFLGLIQAKSARDDAIVARDGDMFVALALREPFEEFSEYFVDCEQKSFSVTKLHD